MYPSLFLKNLRQYSYIQYSSIPPQNQYIVMKRKRILSMIILAWHALARILFTFMMTLITEP